MELFLQHYFLGNRRLPGGKSAKTSGWKMLPAPSCGEGTSFIADFEDSIRRFARNSAELSLELQNGNPAQSVLNDLNIAVPR